MARGVVTKPRERTAHKVRARASEPTLNRRELADLAGVSLRTVDKAIENGIIKAAAKRAGRSLRIPVSELAALTISRQLPFRMPLRDRARIRQWAARAAAGQPEELQLAPMLFLKAAPELTERLAAAKRYAGLRDEKILIDAETKGGVPVIAGTRLTVTAIEKRLRSDADLPDLIEDYPYVDPEVFEVAARYSRTHPRRGRPARPPRPSGHEARR